MVLTTYSINNIPHKIWGRSVSQDSDCYLIWSASALELNVMASELWIEIESCFSVFENWVSVLINNFPVQHFMLPAGKHNICLFRGMDPKISRNIRIVRDTQAMPDDPANALIIHKTETDGTFLPVHSRPLRLEFIGDSLTSAEGLNGPKDLLEWNSCIFDTTKAFPSLISEMLNAEFRCICQSGWGVVSSWDGNRSHSLPLYYDKVAGILSSERLPNHLLHQKYNFTSWVPHAIIINLGTNDASAGIGRTELSKAVKCFCQLVRYHNPKAYILWAYGFCGQRCAASIQDGIQNYIAESNDANISFLLLPDTSEPELGSREHPGPIAHERTANIIAKELQEKLPPFQII